MTDGRPAILILDLGSPALGELGRSLDEARFRVVTCRRLDVALEYLAEDPAFLAIFDASALYLEGLGLAARIRHASPRTRPVFLDADGGYAVFLEMPEHYCGDMLIRPCRSGEIEAVVGELIRDRRRSARSVALPPERTATGRWRSVREDC